LDFGWKEAAALSSEVVRELVGESRADNRSFWEVAVEGGSQAVEWWKAE